MADPERRRQQRDPATTVKVVMGVLIAVVLVIFLIGLINGEADEPEADPPAVTPEPPGGISPPNGDEPDMNDVTPPED